MDTASWEVLYSSLVIALFLRLVFFIACKALLGSVVLPFKVTNLVLGLLDGVNGLSSAGISAGAC